MSERSALRAAIDLIVRPSRIRTLRAEPLPEGTSYLLRIAAGDSAAAEEAAEAIDRPVSVIETAAGFFIEQVLFDPNSDSYRILGASRGASAAELRANLAMLIRWIHIDADEDSQRTVFLVRVTDAWNDLKTPERRAAYESATAHISPHAHVAPRSAVSRSGSYHKKTMQRRSKKLARPTLLRRVLMSIFGTRAL